MTTALESSITHAAADASGVFGLTWLLLALPLFGAAVLLLGGRRTDRWGHWLATAMSLGAFAVGVALFFGLLGRGEEERAVTQHLYTLFQTGDFTVDVNLLVDQLSICFVLLITGVGSLIHIYSTGYMAHDPNRRRFFAYLNLFIAAMLLLVLGDSYLTVYVGWEGVGLASYLLIGFWYQKNSAATAAKKAFVANRVGDIGMALAIMTMFATFGTVSFEGVFAAVDGASATTLTVIGLFLLLAACGKSAQFPLQSWLLDAMEGPTPVSALIHAATMVTAGVYLIVRSNPIFDLSSDARNAVIAIGAITLVMGALIGTAKDDIKKALAASTMSQIGYMVLAAGLGPAGYVFAIFHLLTHGFFKAGMFLGAGSVMHGMNDQVDMRRYGALRAFMVVTFTTFFLGYLAIIGVPPFAGFYSKDHIIEAAFAHSWLVGFVTLIGAGITAFYMTRVVLMTFFGKARWTDDQHPHESPPSMTVPMIILGFGSVASGFILINDGRIEHWLEPVTGYEHAEPPIAAGALIALTLVTVVIGVAVAIQMYLRQPVPVTAPAGSAATRAARADLYGDAFNETVLMRPGQWLTRFLVFFDNKIVDGAVSGLAALFGGLSSRTRRIQTGYARSYALSMLVGAAILVGALLLVRL
jgi:NADH-quinone oxidoreductase subunit L